MTDLTKSPAWGRVAQIAAALSSTRTSALFDADPDRAKRFSREAAGVFLDFSKVKLTTEALSALLGLANAADLDGAIARMFAGAPINTTENRAVLHTALRDPSGAPVLVEGSDIAPLVARELAKMKRFADAYAAGMVRGWTGASIDTVVNIGIGGSDLGPQMAVEALRPYWLTGKRTRFVSNVDGQHLADTLADLDPARTLFIVASKTFTTEETMTNARSARDWFLSRGADEAAVAMHFVALSTNAEAAAAFGISPENTFTFWDWVGGRYSMWSAIGLSVALQVGFQTFADMLMGANEMDRHFRTAPVCDNLPALLALVGVWNRNFLGIAAHAVLPYDQHLSRFPAYLQQADMESNGKCVRSDGHAVNAQTGPVVFGEPGTNGQHAFYQLIHQGTDVISADFIAAALSSVDIGDHHEKLLANFLAQPEALMVGRSESDVRADLAAQGLAADAIKALAPHKVFPGDRPTTSILIDRLSPQRLGALIALYEHKIFCQGIIWGINSFDQWGVELGKTLARRILPEIAKRGEVKPRAGGHDGSTNALINRINLLRSAPKETV